MYIHLYTGEVTANAQDGTQISEDGSGDSTVAVTLNASENEEKIVKCALRCESGYKTTGNTAISFSGTTASKWSVVNDNSYADAAVAAAATCASSITISDEITTNNKVFWVKISSSEDERPSRDTSVKIDVSCKIISTE